MAVADVDTGGTLRGYIAHTDHGWWRFLKERASLREVNFWRPGGRRFAALAAGEPLFFRLKSPINRIGGFGLFARYASLRFGEPGRFSGRRTASPTKSRSSSGWAGSRGDPSASPTRSAASPSASACSSIPTTGSSYRRAFALRTSPARPSISTKARGRHFGRSVLSERHRVPLSGPPKPSTASAQANPRSLSRDWDRAHSDLPSWTPTVAAAQSPPSTRCQRSRRPTFGRGRWGVSTRSPTACRYAATFTDCSTPATCRRDPMDAFSSARD